MYTPQAPYKKRAMFFWIALMDSLNLLAWLCHTVLEWSVDKYALLRRAR